MRKIFSLCFFIIFSLFLTSLTADNIRILNPDDDLTHNSTNSDIPQISAQDHASFSFRSLHEGLNKIGRSLSTVSDGISNILTKIQKILSLTINVHFDPSKKENLSGFSTTTRQMSSLFPTMKGMHPPQNVSFNFIIKIDPFHPLNLTNYQLSMNFHIQVDVLLPGMTADNPFTKCNLTGYITLELIEVGGGLTFYIADYMVNTIEVAESEKANINKKQAVDLLNTITQFYIDMANESLAKKVIHITVAGCLTLIAFLAAFFALFIHCLVNVNNIIYGSRSRAIAKEEIGLHVEFEDDVLQITVKPGLKSKKSKKEKDHKICKAAKFNKKIELAETPKIAKTEKISEDYKQTLETVDESPLD